jgi:hypothetical protein
LPAQKTFGETFGAATGVSDPRLQKIRIRRDATNGSMGLRTYTFDATGLDAGRAQIVPEPLTTGLLGLAAAMALTVRRRPRSI